MCNPVLLNRKRKSSSSMSTKKGTYAAVAATLAFTVVLPPQHLVDSFTVVPSTHHAPITRSTSSHSYTTQPVARGRSELNYPSAFSKLYQSNQIIDNQSRTKSLLGHATSFVSAMVLISALTFGGANTWAENELSAKYGGKGLDTSLVDQTCLINQCSLQAKACLKDDPSCRKGLTCTAKCLGDNACITGCMARYGNSNLDNLLKCTIEDNECIKIAILPGGSDKFGEEPLAPAPVVPNFNVNSMTGSWYKVVGYNPNYDCYACQRNTFSASLSNSKEQLPQLSMEVEFSMPHLLPDGSPPPPSSIRESLRFVNNQNDPNDASLESTMESIGLNDYYTHETMIFDQGYLGDSKDATLTLNKGADNEMNFRRTAHSEGEMFGLKFWENWYIIGENDPGEQEFKFVYYNGKTRQNTYNGAFVYSRIKELSPETMKKVYQIAVKAGMDPNQFCRIRNGCFTDEPGVMPSLPLMQQEEPPQPSFGGGNVGPSSDGFFRGLIASTRISEMLGVEPVSARDTVNQDILRSSSSTPVSASLSSPKATNNAASQRAWWHEVGDYIENPHRHFQVMDKLRSPMEWPEDVVTSVKSQ